jgi:putative transposase
MTTNTWERRALFVKAEWAEILEAKLFEYHDKGEYFVHRYVIMPEHIHIIQTSGRETTLERAARLIKGGSSHDIGERFATRFPVWQPGFTEHLIRDQADYDSHVRYIDMNPPKRGLVSRPEEYAFCSASGKHRLDSWPVASGAKAP